ncbi:MAG: biopolymer transporter ExbD [Spirochaetes bacterium DG_61]|jgi:biopolymer transport protein ExbD|nr:MAG: biopolymer transporter ExbD [Spirochaetes bacterium DG_61]
MRFRRRLQTRTNVDLIPLIDVIFQLVVFFMVTSTFILTPGISLILPKSRSSEPVAMTKLVVTVVSEDEIFVNKERYTLESLNRTLSELPTEELDEIKTVVIEGDSSVSYSLMVKVLDVLRLNGFKGVNLRTREEEEVK